MCGCVGTCTDWSIVCANTIVGKKEPKPVFKPVYVTTPVAVGLTASYLHRITLFKLPWCSEL